MIKITTTIILSFFIQVAFSQETKELKFTHLDVSFERSMVIDRYTSIDNLMDYTDNSSNFYQDSFYYSAVRPRTDYKYEFLPEYYYNRNQFSLSLGFSPSNKRRELNVGFSYMSTEQTAFKSSRYSFSLLDTLTVTGMNGSTETQYKAQEDRTYNYYNLKTKNLLLFIEYLFKTSNDCSQLFIGSGLKFGCSFIEDLSRNTEKQSYIILSDPNTLNNYVSPNNLFNSGSYELLETKTIFYINPYIPFGWNIPFTHKENWLNHFALNVRGNAGIEVQMIKRSTLFTRPYLSAGVGLRYTI